jgi:glutamyl-tRNAGlu reductase-like protein
LPSFQRGKADSEREAAAIQELSTRLINKLLPIPIVRLKEAAAVGQGQVYAEALRYLFDLEGHTHEAHENWAAEEVTGYGNGEMYSLERRIEGSCSATEHGRGADRPISPLG